ncbi:winged helix-turn-helix domain-containing protein [Streptomyces kronopolitis]|uniref:Transcriptional regulator n=2 Tax=Streptomyces kronopolitis TaxID=1612435 RepID=A0ABQ2JPT8_9ACTN|nr:winged helix-turn-helix domain-containing protein [Streptomyces sp. NBRC 13847]MCL6298205.1 winged helix-turn-helix domain-containing protein [Streptomyces kronopolitis]GGN53688.1 transcriptional regulator [Streptomyces kronopolitis]GLW14965.1 transcriptional regulator [Streptomyces sp. NBRC 13847]
MFMNSSTTPLALRQDAGPGQPLAAGPGDEPPLAVDRLPDGTWQLTLRALEPVSVHRLPSDEVHIILAPAREEPEHEPEPAAPPRPEPIRIDTAARTVYARDRQLELPRLEFDLLAHLVRHPRRTFTREQLMAAVWPSCQSSSRTVDVHIARVRRRLGPGPRDAITTVFGIGYKYQPTP